MAIPFSVSKTISELSQEVRESMVSLLVSHGLRELVAAHTFAASLRLAPSLDDKMLLIEQTHEELEHFELTADFYGELTGSDLHVAIIGIADAPPPTSWPELVVAQFLLCRAEKFQLAEHRSSSCRPYAEMTEKLLADEESHAAAGEAALRKLSSDAAGADHLASLQAHVDRWLRLSLGFFPRGDADRESRAVELGLKPRDGTSAMQAYLVDLQAEIARFGLKIGSDLQIGAPPSTRSQR